MPMLDQWPRITRTWFPFFRPVEAGITLLFCLTAGCGSSDGLNRQAMTGRVTLDGQPLKNGAILFEPATQQSGTAVGATIREGSFMISKDQGAIPGSYRVRIYASSEKQAPPAKGQTERTPRPMIERLPAQYNAQTQLRADVAVKPINKYRFDLDSGESPNVR
jgi:hypothetical protein